MRPSGSVMTHASGAASSRARRFGSSEPGFKRGSTGGIVVASADRAPRKAIALLQRSRRGTGGSFPARPDIIVHNNTVDPSGQVNSRSAGSTRQPPDFG